MHYIILLLVFSQALNAFGGPPLVSSQRSPQIKFDLGIASYAFRNQSFGELAECAKNTGVRYLALKSVHLPMDISDDDLAAVLREAKQAGLNVYAGGVIYMPDAQSVESAFAYAKRAGMEMIVGVPDPSLLDLVERLSISSGVKLAVHIHGDRSQLYPDAESVYDLIKHRDASVGICLDVGHTLRLNQDPSEIIRLYSDRILDVQIWDCSSASPDGKAIQAGFGVMDLQGVLESLIGVGYAGKVCVEFWSNPEQPEYGTAYTLGYLRGILSTAAPAAPQANFLTEEEEAAGWRLLFDGETSKGWRGLNRPDFPADGWRIADGELRCTADSGAESNHGGDLISIETFRDFELSWEWKMLSRGGNSGLKYFVLEEQAATPKHGVGLEYQILDDANHPWMLDGRMEPGGYRTAGSAYELYAAKNKKLKPLGEYNQSRLVCHGRHVEHWLNGIKVLEYERGTHDFRIRVQATKSAKVLGYGEAQEGHLLIQDHGSRVSFRNIKIRER
jgi:sugar phosphate isomerase/epimerase